jgi:hypothetical protein
MFNEAHMLAAVRGALTNAAVPPIDLVEIRRRISMRREHPAARRLLTRIAAAAAVVVVAGLLLVVRSPALMQNLEERYHAALIAAGIGVIPMPIPDVMREAIHQTQVSLSEAQGRANFAVVAPQGLPRDIARRRILVAPLAVWTKQKNAWNFDGIQVSFVYARADGRTFDLIADRYSPLNGPVHRYIYDADTFEGLSPNGKPIIKRYETFVWRNGDQELRVVADRMISTREVERIREAMHGVALLTVDSRQAKPISDRIVFYSVP